MRCINIEKIIEKESLDSLQLVLGHCPFGMVADS